MRKETRSAERDLRRAIDRLGHELIGVSVDEFDDGAVVNLEVEVDTPNPHQVN